MNESTLKMELEKAKKSLNEAYDHLENQQKFASVGEITASIGHEIYNILSITKGNLSMLKDQVLGEQVDYEDILKRIQNINNSLERIEHIAQGLKTYTLDNMEGEVISVNKALTNIIHLVNDVYGKEGVVFQIHDDNQEYFIKGQNSRLQQIILTLINNAKNAMVDKHNKRIVIQMESVNNQLNFKVHDSGQGIAPQDQGKIFEKIHNGVDGSGFGLSLVKQYVEQMGGGVTLEANTGKGNTFCLVFPLVKAESKVGDIDEAQEGDINTKNLKVLIIDDEDGILEVMTDFMEQLGCHCESASNGVEALRLVRKVDFDILFCDIRMPRMDGYELIEKLIERYKGRTMPAIVIVSAGGKDQDRVLYTQYESYILQYIEKPFKFEQITKVCKYIAGKKHKNAA